MKEGDNGVSYLIPLQKKLLGLLKEVDSICNKNNIVYCLLGGSVLGAIRHNGFIPWDDDIDIGIPRKDYDRFLKIAPSLLPEWCEVVTYKNKIDSHIYHWCKVEDKSTTLVVEWQKHLKKEGGVFIDVFPLDGAPRIKWVRKLHHKIAYFWGRQLGFFMYSDFARLQGKIFNNRYVWCKWLFSLFYTSFFRKVIHFITELTLKLYNSVRNPYCANYLGEYGIKECFNKNIILPTIKYKFEDGNYPIPNNYDFYLTQLYGDYMQLPPVEKRQSLHCFSKIDITTPHK